MIKIAQGAESIVYKDNNQVIKERFSKKYRIEQLDESLRKFRTRREAKILGKLEELNFPAPKLQEFSDKRMSIVMDFVPGETLKDVLLRGDDYQELAQEIGKGVARLHAENIIHGDLTTSNIIKEKGTGKINFLDFGLGSFSEKLEDKAVDLFLLERSLVSTHYALPDLFSEVLKGYEKNSVDSEIIKRLQQVRSRGRNKNR